MLMIRVFAVALSMAPSLAPMQAITTSASAMEAEINKTGSVAIDAITFDIGKATLQGGSEHALGEIVKLMKAHTDWRFEVQGHTDSAGAKAANLALSAQRAEAVAAWVTSHGIEADRLTSRAYGDTKPVATSAEIGGAKNERIELRKLNEE